MDNFKSFQMTAEQLGRYRQVCENATKEENTTSQIRHMADTFWQQLGKELGFVWHTAAPDYSKGPDFFFATPIVNKSLKVMK